MGWWAGLVKQGFLRHRSWDFDLYYELYVASDPVLDLKKIILCDNITHIAETNINLLLPKGVYQEIFWKFEIKFS